MSITFSAVIRPAVAWKRGALVRFCSACLDGIARYFICRAAVTCLRGLDDRALRDIGIVRSQIEAAVQGFMIVPDRAGDAMTTSSPVLRTATDSRAATRETASWN